MQAGRDSFAGANSSYGFYPDWAATPGCACFSACDSRVRHILDGREGGASFSYGVKRERSFFSLFLLNASFSFFTVESLQFLNIFTYGARDFGRYPFSIYGEKVLKFLTCVIPLALVQYYPLLYLTDRETNGFYALCPVLALLFLVPCVAFFYYGVRKYKSTGS